MDEDEVAPISPLHGPVVWDPLADVERFRRLHARMFGDDIEPAHVGRYEVRERLGTGSSGCVHAGYDPMLRRSVAIKLIPVPTQLAENRADVLLDEARALAALDHPSLVGIHDAGLSTLGDLAAGIVLPEHLARRRLLYMVMELVDGPTLREWLREQPAARRIIDVFNDLGEGLAVAHAAGLVHRDFKPENIGFDETGTPKLLDFGLAIRSNETERPGTPTSVLGTPAYMAPEQHAAGTTGPAADQFAFCVSLWEALTGARPFSGSRLESLRRQKEEGLLTGLQALPRALRPVLTRGLAVDPSGRWPTMSVLLRSLHRRARRPRVLAGVLLTTTVVSAGIAGLWASKEDPCSRTAADVWTRFDSYRVQAALDQTMVQGADEMGTLLDERLGRYSRRWAASLATSCALEPAPRAPAIACLDEVRGATRSVTRAIERHPGPAASKLLELLPVPEDCIDGTLDIGADDTQRDALIAARAQFLVGDFTAVLDETESRLAELPIDDGVRPEWTFLRALTLSALQRPEEAVNSLRDAWASAERIGNPRAAVGAMTALATMTMRNDPAQARGLLELADTHRSRVDSRRRVSIDATWAQYHLIVTGDFEEASRRWQAVIDSVGDEDLGGATTIALTDGVARLAIARGDYDGAEARINRLLEHPEADQNNAFIGNLSTTRGRARWLRGALQSAREDLEPRKAQTSSSRYSAADVRVRLLAASGDIRAMRGIAAEYESTTDGAVEPWATRLRAVDAYQRWAFTPHLVLGTDLEPNDWEFRLLDAGRELAAGRSDAAADAVERTWATREALPKPGQSFLAIDCAQFLLLFGRYQRAIELLETLTEHPSLFVQVERVRLGASAAIGAGQLDRARRELDAADELLARLPERWEAAQLEVSLLRSALLASRGLDGEAVALARRSIDGAPSLASTRLLTATALLSRATSDEALENAAAAWTRSYADRLDCDDFVVERLLAEPEEKPGF